MRRLAGRCVCGDRSQFILSLRLLKVWCWIWVCVWNWIGRGWLSAFPVPFFLRRCWEGINYTRFLLLSHLQATTVSILQNHPSDLLRFIFFLCLCPANTGEKISQGIRGRVWNGFVPLHSPQTVPWKLWVTELGGVCVCQRPHSRIFLGCHLLTLWGVIFNLFVFEDFFYLVCMFVFYRYLIRNLVLSSLSSLRCLFLYFYILWSCL